MDKSMSYVSFVLGLFFWIPLLGILVSGFAIIIGSLVRSEKSLSKSQRILALIGIILGILGLLGVTPVLTLINQESDLFMSLANIGILDIIVPVHLLTLAFFFILFALLDFSKLSVYTKSMISLVGGFILAIVANLPHILGILPSEMDVASIINGALPNFISIGFIAICTFLPIVLLSKNRVIFYILLAIPNIVLVALFNSWWVFIILTAPLLIVLFNHRDIFRNILPIFYKIVPFIALIIFLFTGLANLIPETIANIAYYSPGILSAFIYAILSMYTAGLLLAGFGLVLWIILLVKVFKGTHLGYVE